MLRALVPQVTPGTLYVNPCLTYGADRNLPVTIEYPAAWSGSYQLEVTQPDKKIYLIKIILQ